MRYTSRQEHFRKVKEGGDMGTTTYRNITLERAKLAVKVYNEGMYGCVKNPDLDERARVMFEDGLGRADADIERQVRFIGEDYGGAAGFKAAYSLTPLIARDIATNRAQYEQAVISAQPILMQVPRRASVNILYAPFVKPLHNKSNWQVWFSKFCFWLNQRAFPMEDSRVNDFFLLTDLNSVDKYLKFADRFRDFALRHEEWVPELRKVDDGSDSQPCSDNKLWDKMCYGLADLGKYSAA
jgi:hypothetical protein